MRPATRVGRGAAGRVRRIEAGLVIHTRFRGRGIVSSGSRRLRVSKGMQGGALTAALDYPIQFVRVHKRTEAG